VDSKYKDSSTLDLRTWSASATGSNVVDRELQRELVRAALFHRAAPQIGRYRIGPQLGAGASAVVYAAHDEQLARPVAIKIFVARSSATQLHVLREARALAQVSHPNVVAVYEVSEWNDHALIAMELIRGTTLARWQDDPRRSIHELLAAYLQAGRGLEAAHRAALVHRDFKPANVMVADSGRVAVTDFGLVSHVASGVVPGDPGGSAADTHALVGTPAYAAPEQLRGTSPHPSADIYSFALALGWALTRMHPVEAAVAWRRAIVHKVPRRLVAAICAGLATDPAARGSSITPLLAAIAAALPSRAWRAAAAPPWFDGLMPAPRRWPIHAVIAATAVATAIGSAHMLVEDRKRDATHGPASGLVRVFHAPTSAALHDQPIAVEPNRTWTLRSTSPLELTTDDAGAKTALLDAAVPHAVSISEANTVAASPPRRPKSRSKLLRQPRRGDEHDGSAGPAAPLRIERSD
jgi:serine/threonine protein kinase